MGETLKEFGKFLYNFALIIGGAGIVKPLVEGKGTEKSLIWGIPLFALLVICATALIFIGEKLNSEED